MSVMAISNESRLRRMARRVGLTIVKTRSPAVAQARGGFMVLDGAGRIVAGGVPAAYSLTADDVCEYLRRMEK